MRQIALGGGYVPTVGILGGLVYVAWTVDTGSHLWVYTPDGTLVRQHFLPDASYPDIDEEWIAFKQAPQMRPCALHLLTGEQRTFVGSVGGDPGVILAGGRIVWQEPVGTGEARGYEVFVCPLDERTPRSLGMQGAPDGIDALVWDRVIRRNELVNLAPDVGGYVQRAGDLRVGQYGFGIGVRFDSDYAQHPHWLLPNSENKDPRVATDGTHYAIVSWGAQGVRLVIATRADLEAVPRFADPPPPPPPPPPIEPERPDVSIPNRFDIVQAVSAAHPHLMAQNTPETIKELYWRIAVVLHAADPNFGMLTKSAGENHHVIEGERYSVDAVAYKGAVPVVDIFSSAGDGPGTGRIVWNEEPHRRASNLWAAPPPFPDDPPPPPPPPPPSGDVSRRLDKLEDAVADLINSVLVAHQRAEEAFAGASAAINTAEHVRQRLDRLAPGLTAEQVLDVVADQAEVPVTFARVLAIRRKR